MSTFPTRHVVAAAIFLDGRIALGALLGVGMIRTKNEGKSVILCLCEGEWIVAHDVV